MDSRETSRLTIVRTEPQPCHLRLEVQVPVDRVNQAWTKAVALFQKSARVPGFRAGRTPNALLLRRYQTEIQEEAKSQLVQAAVKEACEQEKLTPETSPRLEDQDKLRLLENAPFTFAVTFDVSPTFEMPSYKGLTVRKERVDVDDGMVQSTIERWLQQRASYDKVDRPAKPGDLLKVTYHGKLSDPGAAIPETAKFLLDAEETWLALREPEILPGTATALVGCTPASTKQLSVQFPADYGERSLAGMTANYTFAILEVHTAQIPELTDEFAKSLGADDADAVRTRVRQSLEADRNRAQAESLKHQVLSQLLDKTDVPLPPVALARETYQTISRVFEDELRRGKKDDDLKKNQEALVEQARGLARQQLKRYYVLRRIAEAEGLSVTQEEIESAVDTISRMQHVSPRIMHRRLTDSGRLADVVIGLRESKTIDRVISLAQVTEDANAK